MTEQHTPGKERLTQFAEEQAALVELLRQELPLLAGKTDTERPDFNRNDTVSLSIISKYYCGVLILESEISSESERLVSILSLIWQIHLAEQVEAIISENLVMQLIVYLEENFALEDYKIALLEQGYAAWKADRTTASVPKSPLTAAEQAQLLQQLLAELQPDVNETGQE